MDQEDAARAIVERARQARPRTSRVTWIVALVVSTVCVIAFVIVLVAEGEPTTATTPVVPQQGLGFPAGLAVGVAVGIAIGYAIARQASRSSHSSRSNP
ncbi:MAG: hypothetical protein H0X17_05980 [Deltaproteobacteria bacterium]|nr:hypothetical protein [Deltaproteobacteria bacterium]